MEDDPPHKQSASPPRVPLTLTSSSGSFIEDDLFEPVCLGNLSNAEADQDQEHHISSRPHSPPRFKPRPSAEVPVEMLHLVDSAIMGNKDATDKIKSMLSGDSNGNDISRSVIDSLFSTMAGRADRLLNNYPFVMQSSRAALVAIKILPSLPWAGDSDQYVSPRTRMVRGLLAALNASTRNRSMCSASGLLQALLETAEKIFADGTTAWDGSPLCQCIQVLAGHSLPVIDLRVWLSVIKNLTMTSWALPLILALEKAMGSREAGGPANSFEFDGESSGLLGPGETRWPFPNGYTFVTWIYIESFEDSSRLFSFLSSDEFGFEAYFHDQFLVVENSSGKGKKSLVQFSFLFKPQCWYFVGIEHSSKHGLLGKTESELRLYVDGNMHESCPFDFLRISKPLAFCSIGTNPPPTMEDLQQQRRQCPLFAEMGPVYVFKEPIGQEKMERLAARGGDTLPSFGIGAGVPWLGATEHVRNLAEESSKLDTEVEGSLYLLYHPSLLSGRFCADASPSGEGGLHRRPAEVLGQVHVASRIRPMESLWALAYGGPMALLPLTVSNVQMDNLEPVLGDFPLSLATTSLSAPIFRIISMAIQHPGNNEEVCRVQAPELLSRILRYLLLTLSKLELEKQNSLSDEELVVAIVSLCQSPKNNHTLKVQLFSTLLLDLKMWNTCKYGLQKKLLSSLADMVFTESIAMRDANALQMLLDGCRNCYWVLRETDSIDTFALHRAARLIGEVNALVDELLVVVEVLIGVTSLSLANDVVRCLISFLVDSRQPNQVARVLHLINRLIVQPNASRADTFAQSFISCGGVEALLVLLQREAKSGNQNTFENSSLCGSKNEQKEVPDLETTNVEAASKDDQLGSPETKEPVSHDVGLEHESLNSDNDNSNMPFGTDTERVAPVSEARAKLLENLGGTSLPISSESARINVGNIDNGDGVVVGVIDLLGALVQSGHLKFGSSAASQGQPSNLWGSALHEEGSTMFDDKVSLLLFALQKAFQAASRRLMTANVYMALMGAAINVSSTDDGLNLYDYGHRFEHVELLLVLLRSLPYASKTFQARAIQDLLFLACSHPESRSCLTCMAEWPEWILEVFISNYEMGPSKDSNDVSIGEIEDLILNFLIIMLEYSMRKKDGWKDVESAIHCAEWLCMVGGSSTGDQRIRREEAMPIFKRRLLGGLLDFAARELQVQTEVIAAAAAGVAAEGLSPEESKAGAENAAHLSVALAENAIVVLMLVEDHLRLQAQLVCSLQSASDCGFPAPKSPSTVSLSNSLCRTSSESFGTFGSKGSSFSSDTGLSLNVLASMADANGQVSAAVMEHLTAAAAAEPYESVRCAFVCYGSCVLDLTEGWKYRSRLWYGVDRSTTFGGGGSGWEPWKSVLEKDSNGCWIERPLMKKSINMLQALLLDEGGITGGLGFGGGSGTVMGGMQALYQLLDSDQPFLCMLRMVLASMREDDHGEEDNLVRNMSLKEGISDGLKFQASSMMLSDNINHLSTRKPHTALLWSVLTPILNMPVSESKRQRVLVASSILYSEVWHAIGKDGKPLRKQYVEAILPPFVAILRRWLPLLIGIHEFTSSDVDKPLIVDDPALTAEALPLEAALKMITSGWAAAFASPPAAMSLAMIAAGTSGGETVVTPPNRKTTSLRRDSSLLERRRTPYHTFSSFQKPLENSDKSSPAPKDKAAAKAAALAAARDLERNAKIGSGRGLSAVAMATSSQRRSASDFERSKRWNISEAMAAAWTECLQPFDSKLVSGKDFSALCYKYVAVLVTSFALARNMQRTEMDRRAQIGVLNRHRISTGARSWKKLLHCLIEMSELFGPFGDILCNPDQVFWKLECTENSSRMRRFLKRNYKGADHLKAGGGIDYKLHMKASEKSDQIYANDPEALLTTNLYSIASTIIVKTMSLGDNSGDNQQLAKNNLECDMDIEETLSLSAEQSPPGSLDSRVSWASSDQYLVQSTLGVPPGFLSSEADERIVLELPSLIVRPLELLRGNFQITTKRINFIIDVDVDDSSSDSMASATQKNEQAKNRSWLISSLCRIFTRRYLLRRSALELFMVDHSNFFFDFGTIEGRKNAYRAIVQACPRHVKNIYLETQRPDQLLERTQLMERWARWELSNFEYLMELNTLGGRSYNDITQYPVFPWVLADYCSNTLDLGNTSSYRDLSKPVGALNPNRLKEFQGRYLSFEDPNIPKFHYASHYSSAATVLYYLSRVEPFTTLSARLQGGKFGYTTDTFSEISSTWNDVLEDMSNVKELVPEMFYLPEMLTNETLIPSGTTQLGGKLDPVRLPPWAESSVDFIYKHRMALESEHVSAHLHEWIDLIFGHKQRGQEAVSANNVFLYITYEGMVDIDKIKDPIQKHAMQDQIAYFGQTPSQLMAVPHLKRRPLKDVMHLQTIFRNPSGIKPHVVPSSERCNVPAAAISASNDSVIAVDLNAPSASVAVHKWQPNTSDGQGTPFLFHHGKVAADSGGGALMRMFKGAGGSSSEDWHFPKALAFSACGIRSSAVVAVTRDKDIITGGHADNSIKLISAEGAKTIETASGHCAPVTCLALSAESNYLVSGSRDTTVILWRIRHSSLHSNNTTPKTSSSAPSKPTSPLVGSNISNGTSEAMHRIEGPMHVLRGHLEEVVCCCVNSDLGLIASCSGISGVLLHSLRRGRLIKKLDVGEVHLVSLSSQGVVLIWNKSEKKICTFTVNGIPIATKILSPFSGNINCIEISVDGENALFGTGSCRDDKMRDVRSLEEASASESNHPNFGETTQSPPSNQGIMDNRIAIPVPCICFLNLHSLKVFHTLCLGDGQDVTAIGLNKENTYLFVSTADKQLIVFTNPAAVELEGS